MLHPLQQWVSNMEFTSTARKGYQALFDKLVINESKKQTVNNIADSLVKNKSRYETISRETGVPWFFIALTHKMESNCDFTKYLGNGEPLSRKTTLVPKGRGPFKSFEEGAIDALKYEKLNQVEDWSLPHTLYLIEKFNGFGYVSKGINSPYLWSYSNLYTSGKYVSDGVWDSSAVSQQCGAAVILKAMIQKGYVSFGKTVESTSTENKIATEKLTTEQQMSALIPILSIAELVAPQVAKALGGPLAGGVVALLAKELECAADPVAVGQSATQKPAAQVITALKTVSDAISSLAETPTTSAPPAVEEKPFKATPSAQPTKVNPNSIIVDTDASTIKSVVSAFLFVLASFMVKDAAMAHTIADMIAPAVIAVGSFAGGGALQWLLRRSIGNSNAATLEKAIGIG